MGTKIKSYWNERWAIIKAKAATKTKDYYFSDYGRLKSIDKLIIDRHEEREKARAKNFSLTT